MGMITMSTSPPYVGIKRILKIMQTMCKKGITTKPLADVAVILGSTVGSLQNALATLKVLDFAVLDEDHLILTDTGLDFCIALAKDKDARMRSIVADAIERNEILSFTLSLVDERGAIHDLDLGKAINVRYSKGWKSIGFIRQVGRACASIIAYTGNAHWKNNVLSVKPVTQESELPLYPPELFFNGMVDFLRKVARYEQVTPEDLVGKEEIPKGKISGYLAVTETLGMIEKDEYNAFRITDDGFLLADPITPMSRKTEVFRAAIIRSPYIDVARRLAEHKKEINANNLGEALGFWMNRRWKESVQNHYGKKLLNWYKVAEIVEKIDHGLYKIVPLQVDDTTYEGTTKIEQGVSIKDLQKYFIIGRHMGMLEGLGVEDHDSIFDDSMKSLGRILADFNDIAILIEALPEAFEMANELEEPMVYLRSLRFLNRKILEKLELTDLE